MNTSKDEFLSALLDDEAGDFERRRLLDELAGDDKLARKFGNYALIGEVMRAGPSARLASVDLLSGIRERLDDEPVYNEAVVQLGRSVETSATAPVISPLRRPFAQYGMAAALALATVAGVWLTLNGASEQPAKVAEVTVDAPVQAVVAAQGAAANSSTQPAAVATDGTGFSGQLLTAANDAISPLEQSRASLTSRHLDRQTRDTLKQYVTLHMQHRASNVVVPSIQAASYSQ